MIMLLEAHLRCAGTSISHVFGIARRKRAEGRSADVNDLFHGVGVILADLGGGIDAFFIESIAAIQKVGDVL